MGESGISFILGKDRRPHSEPDDIPATPELSPYLTGRKSANTAKGMFQAASDNKLHPGG